ncbi:MAG: respiratory nitrate reductase subunit gamma [Planctomycetota bacterium]
MILHLLTYLAVIVFVVAVAARAVMLYRMPIHIRWELYPVPHEGKRAEYGGSYYENGEWWTHDRHFSLVGTLKYMLPEMIFLKSLWDENRKLWYRSAPFHWGIYSLGALAGLLVLGALCQMVGVAVGGGASFIGSIIFYLTILAGVASIVLGIAGAAAMLHMRLTDEDLASFTAPRDIFNLAFILVAFLSMGLAFLAADRSFSLLRNHVHSLMTFKMASPGSGLVALEMVVLSLLLAYIPLTHMSHFFIKWFTYHEIRWDDAPNMRRSRMEDRIKEVLKYPVSWSAPHIKGDGKKDWGSVATEDVADDGKEDKNKSK